MNKAEQLIACLEGEIAKRDEELAACRVAVENCEVFRARIAEIEADRDSHQRCAIQAMAELAALKAQEPVAWAGIIEDCASLFVTEPQLWKAIPLYAAPVSEAKAQGEYGDAYQGAREDLAIWKRRALEAEKALQEERIITELLGNALNKENGPTFMGEPVFPAKAQGVVQWPDADEIMQMAFEEGQPADDAYGYCFELEEFDLFIERLMSEVARLNATHVQQVSVPGGWRVERGYSPSGYVLHSPSGSMVRVCDSGGGGIETAFALFLKAMLAAAPAAPAADAGLVLEQAMYALIGIGYHENSGLVHELRQALAAHRAKGVV